MREQGSTEHSQVVAFRQDIRRLLEGKIVEAVETILEEELDQALGSGWYERCEQRRGYRNGAASRRVTTVGGTREVKVPRARLVGDDGSTVEFHSQVLPATPVGPARSTRRSWGSTSRERTAGGSGRHWSLSSVRRTSPEAPCPGSSDG